MHGNICAAKHTKSAPELQTEFTSKLLMTSHVQEATPFVAPETKALMRQKWNAVSFLGCLMQIIYI
jgi:hypothetical protein